LRYYVGTQKAPAAKRGDVEDMLWVDHANYFGPDRRRKLVGLRMRERRRYNYAGSPPPLPTALRQLRMRILEAHGAGAVTLSERARGVAQLASAQGEHDAAKALSAFSASALRGRNADVRTSLYGDLDRVHTALRAA
jgi:hypothetical protein